MIIDIAVEIVVDLLAGWRRRNVKQRLQVIAAVAAVIAAAAVALILT